MPELDSHNIVIADVFDIGPKAPSISLADRVRLIMNSDPRATAEDCYLHLRTTFQVADPEEIEELMRNPQDLTLVAEYINAVINDLDENSAAASAEMRGVLGPATYLILGPEGEEANGS